MPIHKENGGYQWGHHGKVYHGKNARKKAEAQAAAAHAHGYTGDIAARLARGEHVSGRDIAKARR